MFVLTKEACPSVCYTCIHYTLISTNVYLYCYVAIWFVIFYNVNVALHIGICTWKYWIFFYSSYIWTLLLCHLFTRRVRRVGVKQFFLSLWWVLVDGYNFLGKLHWTLESNVKHKTAITTRKLKNKMHPQTVVRALTA